MASVVKATVRPWGNSQGIRIPKEILSALGLAVDEEVNLTVENKSLIITKTIQKKTLEEYAKPYGGKLGPYDEFDFGEDIGIKRWLDE